MAIKLSGSGSSERRVPIPKANQFPAECPTPQHPAAALAAVPQPLAHGPPGPPPQHMARTPALPIPLRSRGSLQQVPADSALGARVPRPPEASRPQPPRARAARASLVPSLRPGVRPRRVGAGARGAAAQPLRTEGRTAGSPDRGRLLPGNPSPPRRPAPGFPPDAAAAAAIVAPPFSSPLGLAPALATQAARHPIPGRPSPALTSGVGASPRQRTLRRRPRDGGSPGSGCLSSGSFLACATRGSAHGPTHAAAHGSPPPRPRGQSARGARRANQRRPRREGRPARARHRAGRALPACPARGLSRPGSSPGRAGSSPPRRVKTWRCPPD